MRCPFCQHTDSDVIDTRDTDDYRIRRRRECAKCKRRFTTYEEAEKEDLFVIKKDGRREKFDRHKLLSGIQKACEKRPVSVEQTDEIANWVEAKIRKGDKQEVKTDEIGELVMERLSTVELPEGLPKGLEEQNSLEETTPLKGKPPPMPLPTVKTSGLSPSASKPHMRPVRPKPVCISSEMKSAPNSLAMD